MPEPIHSTTAAGRARRTGLEPPPVPRPRPRRSRWLLVGLPIFAIFAAFGAIVWLAYESGADGPPVGEPPLIRAPALALKLAPDEGGPAVAEDGEVLDLLSDTQPSDQLEQLLPPPEQPLAPELAEEPIEAPDEPPTATAAEETAESPAEVAELAPPPDTAPEPEPTPEEPAPTPEVAATPVEPPQEPRPAEPPSVAVSEAEPPGEQQSARANEPAPPASEPLPRPEEAEATLEALLAEVTAAAEDSRVAPPAPVAEPVAPPPPAAEGARPAVAPPSVQPAPPGSVSPITRPGREVAAVEPGERLARPGAPVPVEPAPAQSEVAAQNGDYRIQLAAVREEADARRAWDLFLVDLGPVLSGVRPFIERADTANGVFYRVQVGPFDSLQAAESLCNELKQRNASCFVIRR